MTYRPSDKEVAAVIRLPAAERYAHLIKRLADTEEVWGLRDEGGWLLLGDADGRELLPVWPHPAYAEACARDDWAGHTVASIPLDEWLDEWLPEIEDDGRLVAAFPIPGGSGVPVEPAQMRADLERELEQYE